MRQANCVIWQEARRRRLSFLVLLVFLVFFVPLLLVAACQTAPVTPILLPLSAAPSLTVPAASEREAILALMASEAKAAVHDDASRLLELWAADGLIRDANHTPADPADDHTWIGHDAILSRYLTIVFPLPPSSRGKFHLAVSGGRLLASKVSGASRASSLTWNPDNLTRRLVLQHSVQLFALPQ